MKPFIRIFKNCFLLIFFLPLGLWAQQTPDFLTGKVIEKTETGAIQPLIGANVVWLGTNRGVATDSEGSFKLVRVAEQTKLVVSFVGYQADTVDVSGQDFIQVSLKPSLELEVIEVVHEQKSTEVDYLKPLKTEVISEKELEKAACCNLSESFETSPSVDVSFADAVTGTRQIQMLGLAGTYSQITRESMPNVRGLAAIYGLTYIPGAWVESIQLNKGAGSVANGFESFTGQINVELRKPEDSDKMYLNLYANQAGRTELNANFSKKINKKWSFALLLHGKMNLTKQDRNNDSFLDMPLSQNIIGLNRWKYAGDKGLRLQFGIKGTYIDLQGGQVDFDAERDKNTQNHWGMKLNMRRIEGWSKIGKVYKGMPWKSLGLQVSAVAHEQDSYFGLRNYDAKQKSAYANLIYQSIFNNTNHKFRTGLSFQHDKYDENLDLEQFDRRENVVGGFFEYTYTHSDQFALVAGLRADYHNLFGVFVTPRLHLRYALTENTILRASGGRGQRTANVISENNGLLASSRAFVIERDDSDKPYGLDAEVAWNYGLNLTQDFTLNYRDGSISFDFYRTDFQNQIVVDLDQNPQAVHFYNLNGKSYSNSFQTQLDYELITRLDVRLAYRWFDVKTSFREELLEKPLLATHRAFFNLAYRTPNKWSFDYTLNWQGQKRLPSTASKPADYQAVTRSDAFFVMNAQITKSWQWEGKKFEVYLGMENMLNFRQKNPILASNEPFSPYFDSSLVWGPIFGRNTYLGLRYRLK